METQLVISFNWSAVAYIIWYGDFNKAKNNVQNICS
jgi:hypothetical protein